MAKEKMGITTTVPIELIYAAGFTPVDLNNEFISAEDPSGWIEEAELAGFPHNVCAWIKGIFTAAQKSGVKRIVGVTQGDCSNTHVLMEILESRGLEVIPFAYPYPRDLHSLRQELKKFASILGTDIKSGLEVKKKLDRIRRKISSIDQLTWEKGVVSGWENHFYQLVASDMKGDPEAYEKELDEFVPSTNPSTSIRLGYIGVPTILNNLYPYIESLECGIVYNEVQRQFSMPVESDTLEEQYFNFTYPYGIKVRLADINREIAKRRISGIIHYVQSFCFRQMEQILVKEDISVPVLLLEGDMPGPLDGRTRTRIEGFLEMLRRKKSVLYQTAKSSLQKLPSF